MRTITTLVFVFISTFSLFSQTSIKKRIDYCRIIGRQDSVVYYVSYMKMGKEAGAKAFLSKPFDEQEFMNEFSKLFL